jgi:inhibitor of KinA
MRDAEPSWARLAWVADCCLRIELGQAIARETSDRVSAAANALRRAPIAGLVDVTPAFTTLLLTFDLARLDAALAEQAVRAALAHAHADPLPVPRVVEIPVCYEGACALDLAAVADAHARPRDRIVALHSGARYTVAFLGFSPGFPYLLGLPDELTTPRLPQPRLRVPWGSVAIAGKQAGVYPQATAGGWRILGRTPLRLFTLGNEPPALLQLGDEVRFVPITHREHVARATEEL